jgi:hypothetical protein
MLAAATLEPDAAVGAAAAAAAAGVAAAAQYTHAYFQAAQIFGCSVGS